MKLLITDHLIRCANSVVALEAQETGILIHNGRLEEILPIEEMKDYLNDDAVEKLDMKGKYVMPGLIDGHLHLSFSSSVQPLNELYHDDDETILMRMIQAAQTELRAGVTTVRDCGAKGMSVLKLRDFIKNGGMKGPDIISCGMPMTITGGHCNFCGLECDSVDEVIRTVRWLCKKGVDFIKVMVSGGNMTPGSDSLIDQYSEEHLKAIAEEAHARGKLVSGHVHSTAGIERAIHAGLDIFDHCSFKAADGEDYRPELVAEMKEKGIAVSPAVGKAYVLPPDQAAPLPEKVAMWGAFQKSRFQTTEWMYKSGVRILAGTDGGCKNTHFDEYYLTLNLMHEKMKMTIEDVIASATCGAAEILGVSDWIGSLEKGKQADIIAIENNPMEDLMNLKNVYFVMKRGERVWL